MPQSLNALLAEAELPLSEIHGVTEPQWESEEERAEFLEWVYSFRWRPFDWVLACYPWGEEGTNLVGRHLEVWQIKFLRDLQEDMQRIEASGADLMPVINEVIRTSTATGHGVGKTALVAWLIHWFATMFGREPEIVVTADTETQLDTKTWKQLLIWQHLAINGWMFEWTATRYKMREEPEKWFAAKITWSESNPQAFAGTHGRYILIVFDEASGISDSIWETIEGANTTGLVIFACFGNMTQPEGGFYDTQHKLRHRYRCYHVDAREVSFANLKEIEQWREDWGEDSDFFRVRVRGLAPKQKWNQFIDSEDVSGAVARNIALRDIPDSIPNLMGVDVARGQTDSNVILCRRGRKVHPTIKAFYSRDIVQIAATVAKSIMEMQPDLVYIDATGVGGGVYDELVHRGFGAICVAVYVGDTRSLTDIERKIFANLRCVIWERMRQWLKIGDIPAHARLQTDLTCPTFTHQRKTNLLLVEPKEAIKARGQASPDYADALGLTFSELSPVRKGQGRSVEVET